MLKGTARTGDGGTMLVLGLTRDNTRRLHAGQPIKIDGRDIGLPGLHVILAADETDEDIVAQLHASGLITKDTIRQDLRHNNGVT